LEVDRKVVFSNCSKQAKAKAGEKMDKQRGKGQSVRWKAWWRKNNIKCAMSEEYASCCLHQDYHLTDDGKTALKKAARLSRGKDICHLRLEGRECTYWMGTEMGMLGGYGFQGQVPVSAGNGSDLKGKMGTGHNNLMRKKKKQQCNVVERRRAQAQNDLNWQRFY